VSAKFNEVIPILPDSPRQKVAREGMILRVLAGSGVHGTSIEGTDDRDEMGVWLEHPRQVLGSVNTKTYTWRTKPEGVCSGPGDLDFVAYNLRHYVDLVAQGNPTMQLPLFVPQEHVLFANQWGRSLRENRHLFLSRSNGFKYAGYLRSQREGLLGLRSGGTRNQGRADIREQYGFDTKFAGHMVRLGVQGVELLKTGSITLPIPEPDLTWIRDLRVGKYTKQEALGRAEALEAEIFDLMKSGAGPLPEKPDYQKIDAWVIDTLKKYWGWC